MGQVILLSDQHDRFEKKIEEQIRRIEQRDLVHRDLAGNVVYKITGMLQAEVVNKNHRQFSVNCTVETKENGRDNPLVVCLMLNRWADDVAEKLEKLKPQLMKHINGG